MIMISTQRLTGGDLGMDSGQYGARAVPQHWLVIHLRLTFTQWLFTFHIENGKLDDSTVRHEQCTVFGAHHSGGSKSCCTMCVVIFAMCTVYYTVRMKLTVFNALHSSWYNVYNEVLNSFPCSQYSGAAQGWYNVCNVYNVQCVQCVQYVQRVRWTVFHAGGQVMVHRGGSIV